MEKIVCYLLHKKGLNNLIYRRTIIYIIIIAAHNFAVVEISGSLFNNDADSVRLLNQNDAQIDGFEYGKSQQGKSLGRISFATENICLEEPSKGSANNPCFELSPSAKPTGYSTSVSPSIIPPLKTAPRVGNLQSSLSDSGRFSQPAVLGEAAISSYEESPIAGTPLPIRTLAPVSFSYSILTIVSLLIKIKNGLTA